MIESNQVRVKQQTCSHLLWDLVFCLAMGVVLINTVLQIARWDKHGWFKTAVVPTSTVKGWTEDYKDAHLHELSRWDGFNVTQWQQFVAHSYEPLNISHPTSFQFLEIGVGVGAWSRIFLNVFPNASGYGIDLESGAVDIAAEVLPQARMQVQVADMFTVPERFASASLDYVFIPGTLCYADNLDQVRSLFYDLRSRQVIHAGSRLSATMLASDHSEKGSCVTRIPKAFWTTLQGYSVIDLQEMDSWSLPHGLGRYAVFLLAQTP